MDGPTILLEMNVEKGKKIVGIDTDSTGFQCVLIGLTGGKTSAKYFELTAKGTDAFKKWIRTNENPLIAIEGKNGCNRYLEAFFRRNQIQFYSFPARRVANAKGAYVGQHKTNEQDAEAVAHLALTVLMKGSLDKNRMLYFADDDLRDLTRFYKRMNKNLNESKNILWKLIRNSSIPLYRLLSGKDSDGPSAQNTFSKGFINLLSQNGDIGSWKNLSEKRLQGLLGTTSVKYDWVKLLKKASAETTGLTFNQQLMLQQAASTIQLHTNQKEQLKKRLETCSTERRDVQTLSAVNGFGPVLSTGLAAEIIDIRRFANNNNLASYCGLGRLSHSTGVNNKERKLLGFNRRLKDYMLTAAGSYILYNPESHLAGYYRNLVKKGMKKTEAKKRVARALIRKIFRMLNEIQCNE